MYMNTLHLDSLSCPQNFRVEILHGHTTIRETTLISKTLEGSQGRSTTKIHEHIFKGTEADHHYCKIMLCSIKISILTSRPHNLF